MELCEVAQKISEWLGSALGKRNQMLVIFSSCEKMTAMLSQMCDERELDIIWLCASMPRIRTFLTDACQSVISIVTRRPKILVIDPVDSFFHDPLCASEATDFLKHGCPLPLICKGIDLRTSHSKVDAMSKKFAVTRIACETSISRPLKIPDGMEAINLILRPGEDLSLSEAAHMLARDVSCIAGGLHEGYLRVHSDISAICRITDSFSVADIMNECIEGRQQRELSSPYNIIVAGTLVSQGHRERIHAVSTPSSQSKKFGTVWSKHSTMRSKEKAIRSCKGLKRDIPDLMLIRHMLLQVLEKAGPGGVADFLKGAGLCPGDAVVLARLWKNHTYSTSMHAKVKAIFLKKYDDDATID
jgi:hypothetical protein